MSVPMIETMHICGCVCNREREMKESKIGSRCIREMEELLRERET